MGCSMSTEVFVRRRHAIVDACSDPDQIDLSEGKHFWGVEPLDAAVDPHN